MDLEGKKILVFGSGISGESAAALLVNNGGRVILYDGNDKLDREEILERILRKAEKNR